MKNKIREDMPLSSEGIVPVKEFSARDINVRFPKFPREFGIVPVRGFPLVSNRSKFPRLPKLSGIGPESLLLTNLNLDSFVKSPIFVGIVPLKSDFTKNKPSKFVQFTILDGNGPFKFALLEIVSDVRPVNKPISSGRLPCILLLPKSMAVTEPLKLSSVESPFHSSKDTLVFSQLLLLLQPEPPVVL
jgi:hypothetical protein